MGSPRKNGNTIKLTDSFVEAMKENGVECELIWLYDKDVRPCTACRVCQDKLTEFGCPQKDDMHEIFDKVLECDLLILATPIYSWYCTPPLKAALDRLVYGMNKYYGKEKGSALWQGKRLAMIATCGYKQSYGTDLWEQGIIRYCKHSALKYEGMLAERDMGYTKEFMDSEKELHARQFADRLAAVMPAEPTEDKCK